MGTINKEQGKNAYRFSVQKKEDLIKLVCLLNGNFRTVKYFKLAE